MEDPECAQTGLELNAREQPSENLPVGDAIEGDDSDESCDDVSFRESLAVLVARAGMGTEDTTSYHGSVAAQEPTEEFHRSLQEVVASETETADQLADTVGGGDLAHGSSNVQDGTKDVSLSSRIAADLDVLDNSIESVGGTESSHESSAVRDVAQDVANPTERKLAAEVEASNIQDRTKDESLSSRIAADLDALDNSIESVVGTESSYENFAVRDVAQDAAIPTGRKLAAEVEADTGKIVLKFVATPSGKTIAEELEAVAELAKKRRQELEAAEAERLAAAAKAKKVAETVERERLAAAAAAKEAAEAAEAERLAAVAEANAKAEAAAAERRRVDAATHLTSAIEGNDVRTIALAIEAAVAANVGADVVAPARQKKAALEQAAQRPQAALILGRRLEMAMASRDAKNVLSVMGPAEKSGVDQELLQRARSLVAQLEEESVQRVKREEAKKKLTVAVRGSNEQALMKAVAFARSVGVAPEFIKQAEEKKATLEARRRKRESQDAMRALECATAGRDLDALESAIELAMEAGATEEDVKAARCMQTRLQEEERLERARAEACNELESAIQGQDLGVLAAALELAAQNSVEEEVLQRARRRITLLEAESRRQQELSAATEVLKAALAGLDTASLATALERVTRAGLRAGPLLKQAREQLAVFRARDGLQAVLAGANEPQLAAVEAALNQAQALGEKVRELTPELFEKAIQMRATLLETHRQQEQQDAAAGLEVAMSGAEVSALRAAIARASKAGVGQELLEAARARWPAVEEAARQLQQRKQMADALTAAMAGEDPQAIANAIEKAMGAGVDDELLEKAWKRRTALTHFAKEKHVCSVAVNVIETAIAGRDIDALASAIAWGMKAGVRDELLERAKRRHSVLEEEANRKANQREAAKEVAAACSGSDISALQRALSKAKAAGIQQAALHDAQVLLSSLLREREYAEQAAERATRRLNAEAELAAALSDDVDTESGAVAAAIAHAAEVGVDPTLIRKAQKRRDELEVQSALEAVRRQAFGGAEEQADRGFEVERNEDEEYAAEVPIYLDAPLRSTEGATQPAAVNVATRALESAMHIEDKNVLASALEWATGCGVAADLIEAARRKLADIAAIASPASAASFSSPPLSPSERARPSSAPRLPRPWRRPRPLGGDISMAKKLRLERHGDKVVAMPMDALGRSRSRSLSGARQVDSPADMNEEPTPRPSQAPSLR